MSKRYAKIILQPRDHALLSGLFECRVMTLHHAAELYFGGRYEMAKKRLQRLKAAALVASRTDVRFARGILSITSGGIDLLQRTQRFDRLPNLGRLALLRRMRVSDLTLRHELAVMDVRVAFQRMASAHGAEIREFWSWPALIQFKSERGLIKPDAFARVRDRTGNDRGFYLELDRSTKPLHKLVEQARGYRACRRATGPVAVQAWDEAAREHRFTVLYVLQSELRLENLARRLLVATPPIRSLVWLTTQAALDGDPFGAIWVRPRDIEAGSATRQSLLEGSAWRDSYAQPRRHPNRRPPVGRV